MKNITNFIFETYHLKKMSRSGSQMLGTDLGTIAEHSFYVSLIAMLLANKEKANVEKTVLISLIHDLPETRTGDSNFINKRYQYILEKDAFKDQIKKLNNPLSKSMQELFKEHAESKSLESKLVKDADILEQMFCEKIAHELGNQQAKHWMQYSENLLKSKTAKKIAKEIKNNKSSDWWQNLHDKPAIKNTSVMQKIKKIVKKN